MEVLMDKITFPAQEIELNPSAFYIPDYFSVPRFEAVEKLSALTDKIKSSEETNVAELLATEVNEGRVSAAELLSLATIGLASSVVSFPSGEVTVYGDPEEVEEPKDDEGIENASDPVFDD
jgi:hypothetical protein